MSTILFDEYDLGNVLSFYAFCCRLKGKARLDFIAEKSRLFHDYSRANVADYHRSYQYRYGKQSPLSARNIAHRAKEPCDFGEAQDNIILLAYNAFEPTVAVMRMLCELRHFVFGVQWRCKEPDTMITAIHPGDLTPCLYTAADLALLAAFPIFVNVQNIDSPALRREHAGWLAQFSTENVRLFQAPAHSAAAIEALIDRPTAKDQARYFYLTSHLYPSLPKDALLAAWDIADRYYSEGFTYNKRRYPLHEPAWLS